MVDSWSSTCREVGDQQPGPPGADRADVEGGAGREEWAGRAQTLPEAREGPSDLTVSDPRKPVGQSGGGGEPKLRLSEPGQVAAPGCRGPPPPFSSSRLPDRGREARAAHGAPRQFTHVLSLLPAVRAPTTSLDHLR